MVTSVSRADLNYSNLSKAIFISDFGKGEPIDFHLFFEPETEDMNITYSKYGVTSQKSLYTDPSTWTLSNLKDKSNLALQEVVHDLKREIVVGSGISNGYIGLLDIAKKAEKFYIGIDDKAKEILKIYIGDKNGKARMFFSNGGGGNDLKLDDFSVFNGVDIYTDNPIWYIQGYKTEDWIRVFNHHYVYIHKENTHSLFGKKEIQIKL